ncbi:MAG TPA: hypothetical protein VFJ43_14250 [Bacteroidia bacterium]|nr:hypothetical protein [Bacteroidia bacterium]
MFSLHIYGQRIKIPDVKVQSRWKVLVENGSLSVDTVLVSSEEFDKNGNSISYSTFDDKGFLNTKKLNFYKDTLLCSSQCYELRNSNLTLTSASYYYYDEYNKLKWESYFDIDKDSSFISYTYDNAGRLAEKIFSEKNLTNVVRRYRYSYNKKGRVMNYDLQEWQVEDSLKSLSTLDLICLHVNYSWTFPGKLKKVKAEYWTLGQLSHTTTSFKYLFFSNRIRKTRFYQNKKPDGYTISNYEYGKLCSQKMCLYRNGSIYETTQEGYKNGIITESKTYDSSGKLIYCELYKYEHFYVSNYIQKN